MDFEKLKRANELEQQIYIRQKSLDLINEILKKSDNFLVLKSMRRASTDIFIPEDAEESLLQLLKISLEKELTELTEEFDNI